MWRLPLFDATSVAEVLIEVAACAADNPGSYVRVVGYDPRRQCQVAAFVVRAPAPANSSGR
jgi:ribulose-bisphosphate carboxylase small chain